MNPLNDRISEETSPHNKDIVAFLHYITTPQDGSADIHTQSIARVRARLLEEGQLEAKNITHPAVRSLKQNEVHREIESYSTLAHKRPVWQQRFGLLVAVLCVALLTGSFVAVEQLTHYTRTPNGSSIIKSVTATSTIRYDSFKGVDVHMSGTRFKQSSVVIHKGMAIILVSDDDVSHIVSNGYWVTSSHAIPLKEKGMPGPNDYRSPYGIYIIGLFNTVGTYHLYDTIHGGMNLVVIVQK